MIDAQHHPGQLTPSEGEAQLQCCRRYAKELSSRAASRERGSLVRHSALDPWKRATALLARCGSIFQLTMTRPNTSFSLRQPHSPDQRSKPRIGTQRVETRF